MLQQSARGDLGAIVDTVAHVEPRRDIRRQVLDDRRVECNQVPLNRQEGECRGHHFGDACRTKPRKTTQRFHVSAPHCHSTEKTGIGIGVSDRRSVWAKSVVSWRRPGGRPVHSNRIGRSSVPRSTCIAIPVAASVPWVKHSAVPPTRHR